MKFAEVAVDAVVTQARYFSYSVPPSLKVRVGELVIVPFGPRIVLGVVFNLSSTSKVSETRDILGASNAGFVFTETQLKLVKWISSYYLCSLFDAISLMLPPGIRKHHKSYLRPTNDSNKDFLLTEHQLKVLKFVSNKKRVLEDKVLEMFGVATRLAVNVLIDLKLIVQSYEQLTQIPSHKYRGYVGLNPNFSEHVNKWIEASGNKAPRQLDMLSFLLENPTQITTTEARKKYGFGAVKALLARGWIREELQVVDRDPLAGREFPPTNTVRLTPDQEETSSQIKNAIDNSSSTSSVFLIEGVTGSGKTEIYLNAAQYCMSSGKRVIVMVPEIALTHQTVERFASKFPGKVAVLHSGLPPGQRFDQWNKISNGVYEIVIGSRSGIFAPQPNLGLIIIDEEHEWTYKQHDASPRYHARDVALKLAKFTNAVLLLGSASPDVESYHRSLNGYAQLTRLTKRVSINTEEGIPKIDGSSKLASIQVIDMRRELREGNRSIFSRSLLQSMKDCFKSNSQVILFLNRRGSASFMQCRNCGHAIQCRRCDISMTYHKDVDRLFCHYCGDRRISPVKCPDCLGYNMSYRGLGTQSVVDEVITEFPEIDVLRWDRDTARRPRDHEILLEKFRSGNAQVLVGTQMIAKGLHFPSVTLVGVVSADAGLNIPDYRSGERTFQLIHQVAGRSGRGELEGKVIVQTYQPDNYAIRAGAMQDYRNFYFQELEHRREQKNPPFSRLIRFSNSNTNRALSERNAFLFSDTLRSERDSWGYSGIEILGPTPGYPARVRGQYRWQIILRGSNPRILLDKVLIPKGWIVDVDPLGVS